MDGRCMAAGDVRAAMLGMPTSDVIAAADALDVMARHTSVVHPIAAAAAGAIQDVTAATAAPVMDATVRATTAAVTTEWSSQ